MALPKVNETITYNVVIPSTGKKVEFRPYLVKEEKVLLLAYESEDPEQIMAALKNTIRSCCCEDIDVDGLTTFDLEYIFIKLRTFSVGETSTVLITCENQDCLAQNEVEIDLSKVEVGDQVETEIPLTNNFTAVMRYPSYKMATEAALREGVSKVERMYEITTNCLLGVKGTDEYYDFSEYTHEEINNWLEELKSEQLEKLFRFIDSTPTVRQEIEFTCTSCEKVNKSTLEGLTSFF